MSIHLDYKRLESKLSGLFLPANLALGLNNYETIAQVNLQEITVKNLKNYLVCSELVPTVSL